MEDLDERVEIARRLITAGPQPLHPDLYPAPPAAPPGPLLPPPLPLPFPLSPPPPAAPAGTRLTAALGMEFPEGRPPVPQPFAAPPSTDEPLPNADAVVVTWTIDEQKALCDVLTPGQSRLKWYRYTHNFDA